MSRPDNPNLDSIFYPKSIAIIGASTNPTKIGHAILRNFIDGGFPGSVYPINPKAESMLGLKSYPSVSQVPGTIDSVVVCIPAPMVPAALEECGTKGVRGAVVISGGFSEVGNAELEQQLVDICVKHHITMIGPNCMGVLNPASRVDSIFLPVYKLGRPKVSNTSFLSQSGAIGGCILDLVASAGMGMGKFVSYGNASLIDEVDLLEYFEKDPKTDKIVMYLEGVKRAREFLEVCRRITHKKPIIAIKGGTTDKGAEATKSHTGSLAGSAAAYQAVFRQAHIIEAENLQELFRFGKIFHQPMTEGKRIAVITNGGGLGVLTADKIVQYGLSLAEFSPETAAQLRMLMPGNVSIRNPLDLVGDADSVRYGQALELVLKDTHVDATIIIILFQTAGIDSSVVNVVVSASDKRIKPMVVVSTGGEFTEMHRRILDSYGVPTYGSPTSAVRALANFSEYYRFKNKKMDELHNEFWN